MADRNSARRIHSVYDRRHFDRGDPYGRNARLGIYLHCTLFCRLLWIPLGDREQCFVGGFFVVSDRPGHSSILHDAPAENYRLIESK